MGWSTLHTTAMSETLALLPLSSYLGIGIGIGMAVIVAAIAAAFLILKKVNRLILKVHCYLRVW